MKKTDVQQICSLQAKRQPVFLGENEIRLRIPLRKPLVSRTYPKYRYRNKGRRNSPCFFAKNHKFKRILIESMVFLWFFYLFEYKTYAIICCCERRKLRRNVEIL